MIQWQYPIWALQQTCEKDKIYLILQKNKKMYIEGPPINRIAGTKIQIFLLLLVVLLIKWFLKNVSFLID